MGDSIDTAAERALASEISAELARARTKFPGKNDSDKNRLDLIPPEAVEALGRVLTHGAVKYADRNWERGMRWGRAYAALQRHLWAWWGGENTDPETSESHLAHALCNAVFLLTYEARGTGEDDRPSSPKLAAAFKSRRTVSGADMTLEERQALVDDLNRRQRAMEGREPDVLDDVAAHYRTMRAMAVGNEDVK